MSRPRHRRSVHDAAAGEPDDVVAFERAVERVEGVVAEELDVVVGEDDPRKAARIEAPLVVGVVAQAHRKSAKCGERRWKNQIPAANTARHTIVTSASAATSPLPCSSTSRKRSENHASGFACAHGRMASGTRLSG